MVENNNISLRDINRKNIFKIIFKKGPISRIGISRMLKISRPTVTNYINELIEEGLIAEIGKSKSTALGGKRAVLVDLNGNLWVGTEKGLNFKPKNSNKFQRFLHDPKDSSSISSETINAILHAKNGDIWIGTYYNGVGKFDGTNWTIYDTSNSEMPDNEVLALAADGGAGDPAPG